MVPYSCGSWYHSSSYVHPLDPALPKQYSLIHSSHLFVSSAKCHPSPLSSMPCRYATVTHDWCISDALFRPTTGVHWAGPHHTTPTHHHHNLAIKTSGTLGSWSQDEDYVPVTHLIVPSSRSTSSHAAAAAATAWVPQPTFVFECWTFGCHCIPQRLSYAWSSKPLYRP